MLGKLSYAVVAAASLLSAAPCHAGRISGSFSGRAYDSRIIIAFGAPWSYSTHFDGAAVTGTFTASDIACEADYGLCFARIQLTFKVIWLELSYPAEYIGTIEVQNNATGQGLLLSAGFNSPYLNASLNLNGPANAFVEGTDFDTLHPGEVYQSGNAAYFFYGRDIAASVALNGISIDAAEVPVPEPASWLLLLTVLAGLWSRRNGMASRTAP